MKFVRMFTVLLRLGASWTDRCDGERVGSCKKYNHALNTPDMNRLNVVQFDFGVLTFCGGKHLEVAGLRVILLAPIGVL